MAEFEPRRRLTQKEMLEMQGQNLPPSNAPKMPSPWIGITNTPTFKYTPREAVPRSGMANEYPPTPNEKIQFESAVSICKTNEAILSRVKGLGTTTVLGSSPGGELNPKDPAQKKVIDELKAVFGIANDTEARIVVAPNKQGTRDGIDIIARTAGNDKTVGQFTFSPAVNRILSFKDADTQKNVDAICKSTFAVLDRNKELFDRIKIGDQAALGKLTAELGKAAGLKDGEKFTAIYQPGVRRVEMPDGTTVKTKAEVVIFRQPSGNMIQVERTLDAENKPTETGYRCNGGFVSVGALKANLDNAKPK